MQTNLDFQSDNNIYSNDDERFLNDIDFDIRGKEMILFLESMYGQIEKEVIYAIVFLNLFKKAGHICLPLNLSYNALGSYLELDSSIFRKLPQSADISVLKNSVVTGSPGELKPFIIDARNRFHMHKSWSFELLVSQKLKEISAQTNDEPLQPELREFVTAFFYADSSEQETD